MKNQLAALWNTIGSMGALIMAVILAYLIASGVTEMVTAGTVTPIKMGITAFAAVACLYNLGVAIGISVKGGGA
jgi:hypothetical protein